MLTKEENRKSLKLEEDEVKTILFEMFSKKAKMHLEEIQ